MEMTSPNVIVFFTDQQRWDTTGVHGNPLDLTPNFDRMAQQGTHVAHSFTCQPVCGPARSCMQTGLYATQTGCYRNGIGLPRDAKTLAHYFREGGYTTGYIGKWHLAENTKGPVPETGRGGYDYWLASNTLEFTSDAYDTVMYDNDNQPVKLPGYRVDAVTDAVIRYIDQPRDQPFYLFVSYIEPHHQNHRDDYPAPDGYEARYRERWIPPDLAALGGSTHQHLAGYYGMVRRLDEALGRLLDALKSLNMLDNTIVLFTSDHGNHFKTRNAEYKRSGHEASIRVPTAIQGPGFNGGGRLSQLVSLMDIPPTLLDAAGLPVPEHMQGQSFLPLAQKKPVDWPEEMFVQISEAEVGRAVRTHRWKYGVTAPQKDGWDDSGSDRYVEAYLYDLLADPYELKNLIDLDSHDEVKQVMRTRLLRRMQMAGEAEPQIERVPSQPGGQRTVTVAEAWS
ncbi:MAG: sulfatase-like hydrolase/transferase [Anaerolineae bacterium]|nr:sulfatase-like hydrolase/transferase [Anaerolineae bacterium]